MGITDLDPRSRDIFRTLVSTYLGNGEPVGSRTLSQAGGFGFSPATIRNIMAELEENGLLYSPHISAGRMPTQKGLRFYVDGLMERGRLSREERRIIETECVSRGQAAPDIYERAGQILSGLSECAGLVIAPKRDVSVRSIHFVRIAPDRALVVLVSDDQSVENRLIHISPDTLESDLEQASNFLNDMIRQQASRQLGTLAETVRLEMDSNRHQLDHLTMKLIADGLAHPASAKSGHIIVHGRSHLLQDVKAIEELEQARALLSRLEEQETMLRLLDSVSGGEGVQIYIGSENQTFGQSGWSLVLSPYKDSGQQIVGAIGVIGPTRLNYGRIIPLVDYTSQVITRLLG